MEFRDKVAVITGGASGIGLALGRALLAEGARVVLADVDRQGLEGAAAQLDVLTVVTDVASWGQVQELARLVGEKLGPIQLLFNNAGVTGGGNAWDTESLDWNWVLSVNLQGVIHGLRAFVPQMLAQDCDCAIVNTGSVISLLGDHVSAPYQVSKHAVLSLSENLQHSLEGTRIRVACLCPGAVRTNLAECQQWRPEPIDVSRERQWRRHQRLIQLRLQQGLEPEEVAQLVLSGIREGRFLIQTHPEFEAQYRQRLEGLLGVSPPKRK